jgi:hypothetical protein
MRAPTVHLIARNADRRTGLIFGRRDVDRVMSHVEPV